MEENFDRLRESLKKRNGDDDVMYLARSEAKRSREALLTTIFLSNPSDEDKPFAVERMSIKSIDPYTALDKSSGTSVLLKTEDQYGRHSGYLTSDPTDEVREILNGVPNERMLAEWIKRLDTIRATEHSNMGRAVRTLHAEQEALQRNATKDLLNNAEDNKKLYRQRLDNILRTKDSRGFGGHLKAAITGKARGENESIEGFNGLIEGVKLEIVEIKEDGQEKLRVLDITQASDIQKLNATILSETSSEAIEKEHKQFAEAFKYVMLSCKKFDDTKPENPVNALSDANDNDDFDAGMDLSLGREQSLSDEHSSDEKQKEKSQNKDIEAEKNRSQDIDLVFPRNEIAQRVRANPFLVVAMALVQSISTRIQKEIEMEKEIKSPDLSRDGWFNSRRDRDQDIGMER